MVLQMTIQEHSDNHYVAGIAQNVGRFGNAGIRRQMAVLLAQAYVTYFYLHMVLKYSHLRNHQQKILLCHDQPSV